METKIKARVEVGENDGVRAPIGKTQYIIIESHPIRDGWNGLVVLKVPGATKTIAVLADELIQAVERCHNLK